MAKVKEVTVGKSVLVSLGQNSYENVRIELSLTMEIEEGDDVAKVRDDTMSRVNEYIRDEVDAVELKERRERSKAKRFGV